MTKCRCFSHKDPQRVELLDEPGLSYRTCTIKHEPASLSANGSVHLVVAVQTSDHALNRMNWIVATARLRKVFNIMTMTTNMKLPITEMASSSHWSSASSV